MNSSAGDLSEYFILNRQSNIPEQDCEDISTQTASRNNPDPKLDISARGIGMIHSQNENISRTRESTISPSYSEVSEVSSSSRLPCQLSPQSMTSPHFLDSGYSTPSSSSSPSYPSLSPIGYSTPSSSPSYPSLSLINSKCNNKQFGEYIAEENLRVDSSLNRRSTTGRSTTWFFLLQLLIDPTKKSVIAWTGNGMEFRIFDHIVLTALWNRENNMTKKNFKTSWETLKRNIRTAYQKDIIRPTCAKNNAYAFLIEPSIYVGMTRKLFRIYIALNNIDGPLTTGSPIPFALPASTFPRGNRLQINRPIPLREDGSPEVNYACEYITIELFEEDR